MTALSPHDTLAHGRDLIQSILEAADKTLVLQHDFEPQTRPSIAHLEMLHDTVCAYLNWKALAREHNRNYMAYNPDRPR